MAQLFSRDFAEWTQDDKQKAEEFLKCNKFFNLIYDHKHVHEIFKMIYYIKILPQQAIYLNNNKRPSCIVLLSGNISIYTKQPQAKVHRHKKSHKNQQKQNSEDLLKKTNQLISFNDTLQLNSQCKLASMHGLISQCIFVPSFLYHKFIQDREQQRNQITFEQLSKVFGVKQRRAILHLVKQGCQIKQKNINNYLFRKGDIPEYVYIILQGSIKVGQPESVSQSSKINSMKIISKNTVLGEIDLCLQQRQVSAICCSSHCRFLLIPKMAFLKFTKHYLPQVYKKIISNSKQQKNESPKNKRSISSSLRVNPIDDSMKLPSIFRYRAHMKSPEEQQKQYRLIRNSHMLLDASPPKLSRIRSKSSIDDGVPHDIMYKKSKLFKKIRPNARPLDLSNRIF